MAVGAIEPQFYAALLEGLGLADADLPGQMDSDAWPEMKERLAALFATKSRDEWEEIFDGTDACVAPVLSVAEAPTHPHNVERGTFTEVAGVLQPGPAPRFGATPGAIRRPPPSPGFGADEVLAEWGVSTDEISQLRDAGSIA